MTTVSRGPWRIYWEDFAGRTHSSVFFIEGEAMAHLATLLSRLMDAVSEHAGHHRWLRKPLPLHAWYAETAPVMVGRVRDFLARGEILEAYDAWHAYVGEHWTKASEFAHPMLLPLDAQVGTVVIEGEEER